MHRGAKALQKERRFTVGQLQKRKSQLNMSTGRRLQRLKNRLDWAHGTKGPKARTPLKKKKKHQRTGKIKDNGQKRA